MAEFSLFDLFSPWLSGLDSVLSDALALAPVWRIAIFAALASVASMWLFKRLSNQDELANLKQEIKDVQKQLLSSDRQQGGPDKDLRQSLKRNFKLTGRQLWLSFWPALAASVPVVFLLVFCSNQFGSEAFEPGSRVYVTPIDLQNSPADYEWLGVNAQWDARKKAWTFYQPAPGQRASLMLAEQPQLSVPTAAPASVLHKKQAWNYLIANPAGYLDSSATVERFEFNAPTQVIIGWGPGWMRGWLFAFIVFLLVFSIAIKILWKIE